jgi:hypothetical protein
MGFRDWFKKDDKRPKTCQPLSVGGHHRHLSFLTEQQPNDSTLIDPRAICQEIIGDYQANKAAVCVEGNFVHFVRATDNLQLSVLGRMKPPAIVAAYPYVDSGARWDIEVKEIYPWEDGCQGQIIGSCHGIRVALFDCFFFKNSQRYRVDTAVPFAVSALAYHIGAAGPTPPMMSDDFCGFMPIEKEHGGDLDEINFVSSVVATKEFQCEGVEMVGYEIPLVKMGDAISLAVTVYSHKAVEERRFTVGDRIAGVAWVFGWAKF